MNYGRLALAALGEFVAYMAVGSLLFVALPSMKTEFQKYPAVYRDHDGQMSHMPFAMGEILVSIVALSVLYAWLYRPGIRRKPRHGCRRADWAIRGVLLRAA